jgi:CDP-6-deoxy-D-xylo-4-hexulose-3-dehydrase
MKKTDYWWPLMGDSVTHEERLCLSEFILSSDRLTYGNEIALFESMWSQWNESIFSVYVSSGTAANYLMILSCKHRFSWLDGDEILVPAITWGTTISAIMNLGLRPIFVDVDPSDLSMSVDDAIRKITKKTRAIFLTHVIGIPNQLSDLLALCEKNSIHLLEDCCESHGATWNNKKVGNFGTCSSYSFFWGHHMTTIEGGMLCLKDEDLLDIAKSLRNHGLTRDMREGEKIAQDHGLDTRFTFAMPGLHCRGTEIHAKLGQLQLRKLDSFISQRNANYFLFVEMIKKYSEEIGTFRPAPEAGISSYCLPFVCKDKSVKVDLMDAFEKNGIETRPLISGNIVRHPFVLKYLLDHQLDTPALPNANFIHDHAFYVGNSQFVSQSSIERMDFIIEKCLGSRKISV